MIKNVLTELCSSSLFRGCSCSVGAGRNGESRSRKGNTCQVRASRQTPLRSFLIPPPLLRECGDLQIQGTRWGFYRPTHKSCFRFLLPYQCCFRVYAMPLSSAHG